MCDRYALPDQLAAEREFSPAQAWWQFTTRFNVAPQQYVPAIRLHNRKSEAVMMRWGLLPPWAVEQPIGEPPHCIDVEDIEQSKIHRAPWLNGQRCILPISGFYVWRLTTAGYRQPYFVRLRDRSLFGLAAIWDRFEGKDEDVIESCSVVRVAANEMMLGIANTDHRMPAILRRKDYETWLRATPVAAKGALQPYNPQWMQAYAVSPRINSTAADDPDLIRPAA
jgi:putative SOS response-associated peptidase YedK